LGLKGSWSGTFHLPGGLGTASYSGTYNLVADLTALVSYTIRPDLLYGAFWGHAEIDAAVSASGSYASSDGKIKGSLSAKAQLVPFDGTATANGKFAQVTIDPVLDPGVRAVAPSVIIKPPWTDNGWRVTARAEYTAAGLLGAVNAALKASYDSNPSDNVDG